MGKIKKLSAIALWLIMTYAMGITAFTSEMKVELDGNALTFDQPPIIQDGRTLVPLRVIFEALGASIEWNNDTQTVISVREGVTIEMQIGNRILTRNGEQITLDVPPQIIGSRTLVPVRAVAESFGSEVIWEQSTQTVKIATPEPTYVTSSPSTEIKNSVYRHDLNAWMLGCSAILAVRNNEDPYSFGMGRDTVRAKSALSGSWSINNREDLIETVIGMTLYGHNEDFAEVYGLIASLTNDEFELLMEIIDDEEKFMWVQTKALGEKWGRKQIKAWDWFRMFHIVGWGYSAGYITMDEAYELLEPVIELLLANFSSWEEATNNYMDGYAWWSRIDMSKNNDEYNRRIKIQNDQKGNNKLLDPTVWKK